MHQLLERRWVASAGTAIVLLALSIVLMFRSTGQLRSATSGVAHSHQVTNGLESVLSLAKDAETGHRGFVITGDPRYLEPYDAAITVVLEQVDALERLTADDSWQQAHISEVRARLADRLDVL